MIHSITVTNPSGEQLKLELARPELTGLIVERIDGLGPAPATINTVDLGSSDGAIFSSSRVQTRNIVITLRMIGTTKDPSIENARLLTYKFFPLKKKVELLIRTDNRLAQTYGYVESNDPDIFSQNESAQISIICPDPYFYELGGNEFGFYGVHPMFEFPFQNDSLTENLLEVGELRFDTRSVLNYVGDADTGFVMTLHALSTVKNVTIFNVKTREWLKINTDKIQQVTGKAFGLGDDIIISTVQGEKYVRLLRKGLYTNIISAWDKNGKWLTLTNGDNIFTFTAEVGEQDLQVTFTYRNAYGGI